MRIRHTVRKIRNATCLLWLGLGVLGIGLTGSAAEETSGDGISARIEALKVKFPHDAYWNHVGSASDMVDGYTMSPCTLHKVDGIHIEGTNGCTCNHFVNQKHGGKTTQCMGFAYKLGYDVFGDTTWTRKTENPVANVRVGDILRLNNDTHSVFVTAKNGNFVVVGEANYPNSCKISWGRTINLAADSITYYERADNYDYVVNTAFAAQNPGASGTDTTGTGWVQAEDGSHFYYVKDGLVQKQQWVTVGQNRYYVDENGIRVTGFYTIGVYTYYFDADGVCILKQWFDVGKKSYYANEEGIVLKSQWLYKDNVKVYVKADGSVARSELVNIGGSTYYFNSKGKRSKGFKKYNGKYYYSDKNGVIQKKKWITKGGKKYYMQKSGVRAQDKLLKIGGYRYYFDSNGVMVKKKRITYNGKVYKADRYGHCKLVQ